MSDTPTSSYQGWISQRLAARSIQELPPDDGKARWLAPIAGFTTMAILLPWYFGQFFSILHFHTVLTPSTSLAIVSGRLHNYPAYWVLSALLAILAGLTVYTLVHFGGFRALLRFLRRDVHLQLQTIALVTVALWVNAFLYRVMIVLLFFPISEFNVSRPTMFLQNMDILDYPPGLHVEFRYMFIIVVALGLAILQSASILQRLGRSRLRMLGFAAVLMVLGLGSWYPTKHFYNDSLLHQVSEEDDPSLWCVVAPDHCGETHGFGIARTMYGTYTPDGEVRMLNALATRRLAGRAIRDCWDIQLPLSKVLTVEGIILDFGQGEPVSGELTWAIEIPQHLDQIRHHPIPDEWLGKAVVRNGLEAVPPGIDAVVIKADENLNATTIIDVFADLRQRGVTRVHLSTVPAQMYRVGYPLLQVVFEERSDLYTLALEGGITKTEDWWEPIPRGWEPIETPCPGDFISGLRSRIYQEDPPKEGSLPPEVRIEVLSIMDYQDLIHLLDHALIGGAETVYLVPVESPGTTGGGDDGP